MKKANAICMQFSLRILYKFIVFNALFNGILLASFQCANHIIS